MQKIVRKEGAITVVLGAGATRGAEFVKEQACKPPLNNDFFTQLQRITSDKHKDVINNLINDTTELFGFNFRLTFEEFFTQIEYFEKIINITEPRANFNSKRLTAIKNNFRQALAAVFEESIATGYHSKNCKYHRHLVEQLRSKDSIITFNYDCLIDDTLREHAVDKWDPKYGYLLPLRRTKTSEYVYGLQGIEEWSPSNTKPIRKKDTIKLLKLHGSLHWQIKKKIRKGRESRKEIIFKERPYTRQSKKGLMKFEIIPPEWNKEFDKRTIFTSLWVEADKILRSTKHLVLIGYSFTATDLHSLALFRIAIRNNQLRTIIIVNPDKDVRFRTRQILAHGINKQTKIVVFDTFEEFDKVSLKDLLKKY